MSSTKILSELIAWESFALKEKTPNHIVFELWDEANWHKLAQDINRHSILGNLKTVLIILVASFITLFLIPRPWGIVFSIIELIMASLLVIYTIRLFKKKKLTSMPCAIFDKETDLVTGSEVNSETFESIPWQIEIEKIHSVSLQWDDPRFDRGMLNLLDSTNLLLYSFYGRSKVLSQSANILKTWLDVRLQDDLIEIDFSKPESS